LCLTSRLSCSTLPDPLYATVSPDQGGPRSLQQRGRRIIMSGAFGKTEVAGDLSGSHELCIVFLHGLGDSGKDWTNVWSKNIDLAALKVKLVCPTAPKQPVSMNKGIVMNAWFDVPPMGPEMFSKVDQKGFVSSMAYVFSIIKDEVASGTPMQRIIIGGFSQGGCLGIHTVLKCPYEVAGVMLLSTFLGPDKTPQPAEVNKAVPWFWGHGDADPIVPFAMGKWTSQQLAKIGITVDWHTYPKQSHITSDVEFRDIEKWLIATRERTNEKERLVGFDRIGEDPFKELRGKKVVDLEDLSSFSVKELKTCIGDWTERTNDRASLMKVANACVRLSAVKSHHVYQE